jgi:hypothetical protein
MVGGIVMKMWIARDITQKVVWEGTEDEVVRRMQEHQEKYNNN